MSDTDLTLTTPDGPMGCYEVTPEAAPRGAVIVIQEAFGVNEHIRDVTRRFGAAGYHAVAPAMFHRAGGGTADYGDFAAVIPLFEGVTDDGDPHRRRRGHGPPSRRWVRGPRHRRRRVLLRRPRRRSWSPRAGRWVRAVGFYGGGIANKGALPFDALIGEAGGLQTPWLGLFGDEDASIPVDDVEAIRTALAGAPVPTDVVRYAGAQHGFHCDARPDNFHAEAAADAWSRALTWFDAHLATP